MSIFLALSLGRGASLLPGRSWVGSILPFPVGRRTFFCPKNEAILGGCAGLGLLHSQEQGTEGYHGWM